MALCLHHPDFGYYATRPAIGEDGDFITAPMISQMFGELIGLWAVETWRAWARPSTSCWPRSVPRRDVMADMLRAARVAPEFLRRGGRMADRAEPTAAKLQRARLSRSARSNGRCRWTMCPLTPADRDRQRGARLHAGAQLQRTEQRLGRTAALGVDENAFAPFDPQDRRQRRARSRLGEISWSTPTSRACSLGLRAVMAQGGCALLIDYGRDALEPAIPCRRSASTRKSTRSPRRASAT
jgi:SAM-dependent MidA family methyltransferase